MILRPLPLHHFAVTVRDLAAGEAFYSGTLGLPVTKRWLDDQGAPRSVWLALGGGAFLAIERTTAAPQKGADRVDFPGHHCLSLGIAAGERESWRARLAAAGVGIEGESEFTLYFRDPEHNLVALSHHPEPRAR